MNTFAITMRSFVKDEEAKVYMIQCDEVTKGELGDLRCENVVGRERRIVAWLPAGSWDRWAEADKEAGK